MKRHLPFQAHVIWTAIALGLFGGFGLGSHLVYFLAYGLTPSAAFAAMVQVHGHLQLLGWTGLFILGVSLFKLPRLMSSHAFSENVVRTIFGSLLLGLVLKSISQIMLFHLDYDSFLRALVVFASLSESAGILLYFFVIFKLSLTFRTQTGAFAAASLKPFLVVSLVGWFVYALINAAVGIKFYVGTSLLLSPVWNNIGNETYIHGVLLPTCFAFSISTFPIFLRLRAPTWPVLRVAVLYGVGVSLYILGLVYNTLSPSEVSNAVRIVGVCLRTAAILWLLKELDLFRLQLPWFTKFRKNQDRENRPPRRFAGDYGQFGNFEWLLYAAYFWLALGALAEILAIFSSGAPSSSIIRHFFLLGFVTHLILGMAVRIIPGFLGKNRIAYPNLVRLSFALILLATIGRTLPMVLSLLDIPMFRSWYAFSGAIAMTAIVSLGVNLIATVRSK